MKQQFNLQNRKSIRLQNHDYSSVGLYFITITTKGRLPLFGKIVDSMMQINDAGITAKECWLKIPDHFPNAFLHEFVIMPDHIHGIIELTQKDDNILRYHEFGKITPKSLASIVRGFKIGVTKWFRKQRADSIWQRGFYESIIRDKKSFINITKYIIDNPKNWKSID